MRRAPDSPIQRRNRRAVFVVAVVLAVAGSFVSRPAPEAAATGSDETAFVTALNSVRAGAGLPPLTVNSELSNLSRGHAQVMADAGEIFHASPISAGYSGAWAKMGENVGVGANVGVLVDAFVASPGHYANIVDPSFTEVGVGVVWKDSALYTTHRFLEVPGTTTTTTTVPPTTTTAIPEAVPTTAPVPTTTAAAAPTTTRPAAPPTTTTTTTLAPLAPPAITSDRVLTLIELLEHVGT